MIYNLNIESRENDQGNSHDMNDKSSGVKMPKNCSNIEETAWKNLEQRSRDNVKEKRNPLYVINKQATLFAPDEPWNFDNFSERHSIIHNERVNVSTNQEIEGIQNPYLLIGNRFTWFPLHCEDSDLASINYLHAGAPKHWIAIPRSERANLEKIIFGFWI